MSQDSRASKPTAIKDILEKSFSKLAQSQEVELIDLSYAWASLLGPTIAQKSEPYRLRHGTLTIHTKSPSWTQELQLLKSEILQKIQIQFPSLGIKDLRFLHKSHIQVLSKRPQKRS